MLELMPRLDAVVCRAGQSTVNGALRYGVPLVVAPIRLGELLVAEQVTQAGAGIQVSFADATPGSSPRRSRPCSTNRATARTRAGSARSSWRRAEPTPRPPVWSRFLPVASANPGICLD
jgi:UDP:flavonoid glycosyltransferase YjiC (YdhE family)